MSTIADSYLVGLIGEGIANSLSPTMHEQEAAHHGLRYLYRPIDLSSIRREPEEVGELIRRGAELGFNAFNITHPCKQLVLPYLDELAQDAASLEAVNTVLVRDGKLIGHNTDQSGFAAAFAANLADAPKDHAVQIGSGGAGSAVAAALLSSGIRRLHIHDIDPSRAEERVSALKSLYPHQTIETVDAADLPHLIRAADGIVNATPIGMHNHPGTPFDPDLIRPEQWVAEVIYLPLDTTLVAAARSKGCRVLDGGHMAVGQAVDAFRLITGIEPDRTRMRSHFLQLTRSRP
ncbi:shikimate dehydrogenase [Sinomonas susongensis]|uniref:shikimate dehydrogenase n=1 Tax=Sinomonas susongensis TaxID=1324851 RepID=UPI0011085CF3|nr:shikimate dehydrogenase [Sinomonas susongensis]